MARSLRLMDRCRDHLPWW